MTKINNKEYKVTSVCYGDVVWVDLGEVFGSEQGGCRPAIIVSNDKNNLYSSIVNIVPISSSKVKTQSKAYLPTHVPISPKEEGVTGIYRDSVAMCEQARPIDKLRILDKSGHICSEYIINALNRALTIQYNICYNR